ncbi:hypothetical protein F183_A29660 [Bryobacterales bacterium F-183]|nr:hypothetical protein F183_A29660 [Bryobacterales bacterium F-183]
MRRRVNGRVFDDGDGRVLLAAVGVCRTACVAACTKAPIGGAVYRATSALMDAIDELAEVLTGDRAHFHRRMEKFPCAQPEAGGRKDDI